MEHRFNVKAFESTSDEIIEQLVQQPLNSTHAPNVQFILERADLAKFAKSRPLPQDNTRAMQYAIEFVEATKLAEAVNNT